MEPSLETPRRRPSGASPVATALVACLREIASGEMPPEDMLEPALAAILQAIGASAGAICLYDQRHDLLRLAAESGLSDEGCGRLRSVRRGDVAGWDMPLHGLLNRRVYLIESAARNRYVPPLVEPASAVRTIACVPICMGVTPLGSLVLVAKAPRAISEQDVRLLDQPLREVAGMIEAAKRRGTGAPAPAVHAAKAAPAENIETLLALLADAERERAHLAGALEAAAAERAEQARREAVLNAERASELDRLKARLAETEAAAASERARVEECESERVRLAQALEGAVGREAEVRGELEQALTRAAAAREQDVGAALENARAAEQTRAAANAEAETARAELARVRNDIAAAGDEKRRAREELEQLQASVQAMLGERERLAGGVGEARIREQEARTHVEDLDRRIETLRRERETDTAALTAQLETARAERDAELGRLATRLTEAETAAQRERERVEEWEREHERLSAVLQEENAREERARDELRAATERAGTTQREELEGALAAARAAEEARAAANADAALARAALADAEAARRTVETERAYEREEIERLQAAVASFTVERGRLEAALGDAEIRAEGARGRLAALEAATDGVRAERAAEATVLTARLDTIGVERDRLATALAAVEAERDYFAADEAAADAAHARLEEALVREAATRAPERVAPQPSASPPPVEAAPQPATGAAVSRRIVILDEDDAWVRAAVEGYEVGISSPRDAAARVAELSGARVVVNLAAAGAVDALGTLRVAGFEGRFSGCIAGPGADRALPLDGIDVARRPLDADVVLAALRRHGAKGGRVLAAGADADALISLRQALGRQGFSVSIAWDGKQANDLLGMVRPDIVVLDLDLPPRAAPGIVTQLAASDSLPFLLLVSGESDPGGAFATALANPLNAPRIVPLARLLARIVGRGEPKRP